MNKKELKILNETIEFYEEKRNETEDEVVRKYIDGIVYGLIFAKKHFSR